MDQLTGCLKEGETMKRMVKASLGYNEQFLKWYDRLPVEDQEAIDDLADDMGLPLYEDCTGAELAQLHDAFISSDNDPVEASSDIDDADLYVIKLWHEVDPGRDMMGPQAAEEVFQTYADSPEDAMDQVKRAWKGPIDRIEIVDVNPLDDLDEALPYEVDDEYGSYYEGNDVFDKYRREY